MSYFLDDTLYQLSSIPKGTIRQQPRKVRRHFPGSVVCQNASSPAFLPENEIGKLETFLNSDITTNEVEASIGTFRATKRDSNFSSGVQMSQFFTLLNFLQKRNDVSPEEVLETREYRNGFFRKIVYPDGDIRYQKKTRQNTIDSKNWFFRIRNSTEVDVWEPSEEELKSVDFTHLKISEGEAVKNVGNKIIRFKTRYTFIGNENGIFQGTSVDLTKVIQDNGINVRKVYEVELERIAPSTKGGPNALQFLRMIKLLLGVMQEVLTEAPFLKDNQLQIPGEELILSSLEINNIARSYNSLFSKNINDTQLKLNPGQLFEFKNKPKALRIRELFHPSLYAITIKYDGIRRFIYVGDCGIYMMEPRYTIKKLRGNTPSLSGTLLDGEYMEGKDNSFYVFDILFYNGLDVRQLSLE